MKSTTSGLLLRLVRLGCAALVLVAAGAAIIRIPAPANAAPPTAIELADHALTTPSMLADESPYELIDPVGPGGISQDQAAVEVNASTMIGGLYNDGTHSYGGGY